MSDRIFIKNLCLHGKHGVLPEESVLGQKFYLDITCTADIARAAAEDDYSKTICYSTMCDLVAEVSDGGPYRLIETLAERIAARILTEFPIAAEVTVQVRKPQAPMAASFDHVGVEVSRKRCARIGFSLGSNLGDKALNIRSALALLQSEPGMEIENVSHLYRTAPWGKEDQDWFLNACATGWTSLSPEALLSLCKRTEALVGRVPGERWGPRAIDIDILFLGDREHDQPGLTIPHRDLFNRAFVLIPLAEIAGDEVVKGQRIADAVTALNVADGEVVQVDG